MNLSEWHVQKPSEKKIDLLHILTEYEISSFPDSPEPVILSILLHDCSNSIE